MNAPFRVLPNADPRVSEAIERAMGWPRKLPEIARRHLVAEGIVAVPVDEDAPIGSATLAIYRGADDKNALAWIGGMGVLPAWRKRGVARAMLDALLARADEAGVRTVALDATQAGRPLYEKAGFRAVSTSTRWSAGDSAPVVPAPHQKHAVHPISLSEAMDIAEYDLPRFGAKRLPWLLALQHEFPWHALMTRDKRTGNVTGFALASERTIGPLVADDEEAAALLLAACAATGAPRVVIAHDAHADAARVLNAAGYAREGPTCTRMIRGDALPGRPECAYAVGTWALG